MSKYTTSVLEIIRNTVREPNLTITQQIDYSIPVIFSFNFPIFDEGHRMELCRKILMHYLTKEIAYETVGLWKIYLNERLNMIMPYYNELYQTAQNKYDYLNDTEISESISINKKLDENGNLSSEAQSNGSSTSTTKNLESDLPQANYAGVDYGSKLDEGDASNSATSKDSSQSENSLNRNEEETHTTNRKGIAGRSKAELTMEYRKSIINIDKMIVDELYDLFMLIY